MATCKLILAGLISLSAIGCAPVIETIDVTSADGSGLPRHNENIRIQSEITVKSGGAGTPLAEVKSVYPADGSYERMGTLPDKLPLGDNRYRFSGEMEGLNYGGYDLRLTVGYTAWLTRQSISEFKKFLVDAPPACFPFDVPGPLGFSLGPVKKSNGDEFGIARLAWRPQNWPIDGEGHGSVSFQVLLNQFPGPDDEQYYWMVDFMSADLTDRTGWADSNGVTFRAATRASGIYMQPIFLTRDLDDGELHYWVPLDQETGKFMLYPVSDQGASQLQWKVIQWSSALPAGEREAVYIRVYGDAKLTTLNSETTIYLDGVCPRPPGIEPPGGEIVEPIINPWQ